MLRRVAEPIPSPSGPRHDHSPARAAGCVEIEIGRRQQRREGVLGIGGERAVAAEPGIDQHLPARPPATALRERVQASLAGLASGGTPAHIESAAANEVRVRLATVRFDALVIALQRLLAETGARASEFSVVALEAPGVVRAELLISR